MERRLRRAHRPGLNMWTVKNLGLPYEKAVARGLIRQINPFNGYIDSIIDQVDVDAIR